MRCHRDQGKTAEFVRASGLRLRQHDLGFERVGRQKSAVNLELVLDSNTTWSIVVPSRVVAGRDWIRALAVLYQTKTPKRFKRTLFLTGQYKTTRKCLRWTSFSSDRRLLILRKATLKRFLLRPVESVSTSWNVLNQLSISFPQLDALML